MTHREVTTEASLRSGVAVLRRRKWVVIVCTLLLGALALAWSLVREPQYRATGKILLAPSASERVLSSIETGSSRDTSRSIATEIEVMRAEVVREAVEQELGRSYSVDIEPVGETSVVAVTAEGTSPEAQAETVNTFAEVYIRTRQEALTADLAAAVERLQAAIDVTSVQIALLESDLRDIEDRIAALPPTPTGESASPERQALIEDRDRETSRIRPERSRLEAQLIDNQGNLARVNLAIEQVTTGGAQLVSPAGVPSSPFAPDPLRNVVLGLIAGLVVGVGLAFLLELLDDRLRSKEDLESAAPGATVLGLIPTVPGWRDRTSPRVVSIEEPLSAPAEAYRTLRTSVQFLSVDRPVRRLQITSPSPGEGKTTTTANLGVAFARAGLRVAVVSGDLRRPRIESFFGVPQHPGLTSVIVGDATLDEALVPVEGESRLWILPSGPPPPNPSEVLSTRRTAEVLDELSGLVDIVIIDTPPVLPVTDALLVASLVDATLLVVSSGRTSKRSTRRSMELLDQVDAVVEGTVLNDVSAGEAYGYGYGYGYAYGYGPRGEPEPPTERSRRRRAAARGDRA